jgi:hypothetical protein
MASELIGRCRCPVCKSTETATLTLAKSGLPVLTCIGPKCKLQLFARGEGSDLLLRALLLPPEADTPPERTEKPAPAPVRTAAPPNKPAPEPVRAQPAPAPVQAPPRSFWGLGD